MRRLDHIETWVFDLDNTLYPASCRLFDQVDRNMGAFICEFLKLDPVEARALQKRYLKEFGTTLRGLMINHECPPERFLEAAHAIDYSAVQPDARLAAALERLPGRKLIFTNGSCAHAERVARKLGIFDLFEDTFDIVKAGYVPKPSPACYDQFLKDHGVQATESAMFEDMPHNLEAPHVLGMTTVLVRSDFNYDHPVQKMIRGWVEPPEHVHHITDDLAGFLRGIRPPASSA